MFYLLCAGADEKLRAKLKLGKPDDFLVSTVRVFQLVNQDFIGNDFWKMENIKMIFLGRISHIACYVIIIIFPFFLLETRDIERWAQTGPSL